MPSGYLGRTAVALVVILVWSACFVVIKASQADAPPLFYGGLRALLGGLPLLAVAASTGRFLPPPRSWGWIAVLALTNTTFGLAGMFLSVGAVGAAVSGVLANSQALLVAPFAALLFGETLTRGRVVGLLLGVTGVALIFPAAQGGSGGTEGAALGLMAAGGLAAGNLVIKHIGSWVDALTATAWQYVLGALPLLGWSLIVEDTNKVAWTSVFVAGLLFLGLVGSAGASWVWYRLVSEGELIALNGLTLLTPAFSLVFALLIYRERVSALGMLGIAIVLVGVAWVGWPRHATPARVGTRLNTR
ncbi:MAG: DMT family transporter [Candidatus Methylomirabilales bacterium]